MKQQHSSSSRDEDNAHRQKKRSLRDITEKQLINYVANKVAKKLKTSTFVWRKKIERDVSRGSSVLDMISVKAEKKKQTERKAEIQKLKKTREERAVLKAQREEETAMLARERARAELRDWEKKEDEFLFEQSKIGSEIRLGEGRAKPIDILCQYVNGSQDVGVEPSYMVFKGLAVKDMEELHGEILLRLDLDRATPRHVQFWEAVMVVCDCELAEARRKDAQGPIVVERGLHSSVEADVENFLQGQTCKELEHLQLQTEAELRSGNAKVVEFWEAVLVRLRVYKAKARLKEIHAELFCQHRETADQNVKPRAEAAEDNMEMNAMKTMEEGDVVFDSGDEVDLEPPQGEWWHNKYKPRKPKYLNTIRTGYEWNKYNRVHYDHDNPPPKTVQGYKFNVFYPDLIDKSQTPSYEIEKDGNSVQTCIIRFHAGPPYEDIAFRIVNKEWRTSKRDGFKCTFEGGILRLYFNLERYRYRR